MERAKTVKGHIATVRLQNQVDTVGGTGRETTTEIRVEAEEKATRVETRGAIVGVGAIGTIEATETKTRIGKGDTVTVMTRNDAIGGDIEMTMKRGGTGKGAVAGHQGVMSDRLDDEIYPSTMYLRPKCVEMDIIISANLKISSVS